MTFDLDLAQRITDMNRRVARLETLEDGGSSTGGFIEEFILNNNTTSVVSFTNIPQGYQHLILAISSRVYTANENTMFARLNNDGGNNYNYYVRENAVDAFTAGSNEINIGGSAGASLLASFCSWIGYIPHYHSAVKKTPLVWHQGGLWKGAPLWHDFYGSGGLDSLAAITRIDIHAGSFAGAQTFEQNSKFTLYGQGRAAS